VDAADRYAVGALQRSYGDVVSRRAWNELAELFDDGCSLVLELGRGDQTVQGADEIITFVSSAVSGFEVFVFEVMNAVVGPGPTGRMWIHELRWNAGEQSDAYGLYQDTFTKDAHDRWRFASRRYTSISGGRFQP
jgi:hypothetical protein